MKAKTILPLLLPVGGLSAFLLCFPGEMARGVRDGLTLCGAALIPSLFPFFVLCSFVTRSGLAAASGVRAERFMRKLFRLPGASFGAVLLGLCGGYPVGMRMTAQLYAQGRLTDDEAERMSLFCVCAGPAFVVGTVGASMLGSRACGRILFTSLTLSALAVGLLLRFAAEDGGSRAAAPVRPERLAHSLCAAVADAGEAMLSVCAWVLLFSGVCAVTARLPDAAALPFRCLLEAANGCRAAAESGLPLPVFAAILGFGGLAVQCQVLPYATSVGARLSRFWAFRAVAAALSACFCIALLRVFPQAQPVLLVRGGAVLRPVSASAPASAALLTAAAVFIWNGSAEKDENLHNFLKNVKKTT